MHERLKQTDKEKARAPHSSKLMNLLLLIRVGSGKPLITYELASNSHAGKMPVARDETFT